MKHPITPIIMALLALARIACAQEPRIKDPTTVEIMKQKLEYAHYILNAIATENFDLMGANAEKLSKLTEAAQWQRRESPDYETLRTAFKQSADALAKAAKDRNADAASLAYVQLTLNCVNCHKFMRKPKVASLR